MKIDEHIEKQPLSKVPTFQLLTLFYGFELLT